jgi:hypothetical protein
MTETIDFDAVRARNLADLIASGEVLDAGHLAAHRAELKELAGDPDPPHSDDRSDFLSGPVVARVAAEIVAAGELVRGERREEPRRLTGLAAQIVAVGEICRGEVPEDTPVPGGVAGMVVRAAAKARGEIVDDPPAPTGAAAAILRAGAARRGENGTKQPASEAARRIIAAARRARGEAA